MRDRAFVVLTTSGHRFDLLQTTPSLDTAKLPLKVIAGTEGISGTDTIGRSL